MGLLERVVELFKQRVDHEGQSVPDPLVRGSARFPNTRDWRILRWGGVMILGGVMGGLVGAEVATIVMALRRGQQVDFLFGFSTTTSMYNPPELVLPAVGTIIGLFGGAALANRIIDVQ